MIRTVFNLTNDITDRVLWDRIETLQAENAELTSKNARLKQALYFHQQARPVPVAIQHARYFAPKGPRNV